MELETSPDRTMPHRRRPFLHPPFSVDMRPEQFWTTTADTHAALAPARIAAVAQMCASCHHLRLRNANNREKHHTTPIALASPAAVVGNLSPRRYAVLEHRVSLARAIMHSGPTSDGAHGARARNLAVIGTVQNY